MLVLVSFGLVLLATILLVVGLLNDDGLTLIYLSIAASATSAVVLYVAFRRARPSTEGTRAAPAPLADDIAEPATEAGLGSASAEAPAAPAPPPEPATGRAATSPARPGGGSSLLDLDDDEDDEYLFPIADYDGLSASQIVPLLSQLEVDELAEVRAREVAGAGRETVVDEIDRRLP